MEQIDPPHHDTPVEPTQSEPTAGDGLSGPKPGAPPPLAPSPSPAPFIFHGNAPEYFRIWIVNTLLSVLTLGIFSAWAKVRKRRYLRGNTELLGHRFDYTADPRRILVGNLIVVVLVLGYALFGAVYPAIRFLAIGVIVLALPWIIVRSLAFNAHHTVWCGLRFRFHPSLSAAVMVFLLKSVLIVVSLGFYYPAWVRDKNDFIISRHRLGTAYFHFTARTSRFYFSYFVTGILVFAFLVALAVTMGLLVGHNGGHAPSPTQLLPVLAAYAAVLYAAKQLTFALLFNHIWNGTQLDEHRFRGRMKTGRWLGLQVTNLAAIIGTCGLLYPWALIRTTRYVQDCLEFSPAGPLDSISRLGSTAGSAVGDTAAEFVGFDFGL